MSRKSSARLAGIAAVCVFVVIVGVMFWPDLQPGSRLTNSVSPGFAQTPGQTGRSVAEQLSEAFEAASNRVSPSG